MKTNSFEKDLEQLELIVAEMERGDMDLETGLQKFEEGVTLYKKCKHYLSGAEKKINVLRDNLKLEEL